MLLLYVTEIYLGVAVGLAIAILLVILITIVCCERYLDSRKVTKLLKILGDPRAFNHHHDEDLESLGKLDDTWDQTNYSKLNLYNVYSPYQRM